MVGGVGTVRRTVLSVEIPIKTVSDSTVSVALHTDVVVEINVTVYGETA